jgi:chorismate mutase / prephenate dehydratase
MAKKKATQKSTPAAPRLSPDQKKVAEIDAEILRLVNERADVVATAEIEHRADLAAVAGKVGRNVAQGTKRLGSEKLWPIFRELSAACRTLASRQRVAYLGPQHTFSHVAAIEHFGAAADLVPVATIPAVFEEVERGTADFGIVPLENSTDGRVSDTLDCFARTPVHICGELPLRIHHCLLGKGSRAAISTVFSKPQALSQCRNWLAKHLPQASAVPLASTAEAARRAADDETVAAIAGSQAAKEYGLEILAENIEDQADNITRFAVIASESAPKSDNDKTALMLELAHEPGALADAMAIFKRNRLNMTWIESFPVAGSRGRYLFFVEFVGHATQLRSRRAIAALEKKSQKVVVLGSYAHREPIG